MNTAIKEARSNAIDRSLKNVTDESKQDRRERFEQQRMDNESPAAGRAPAPGEHVPAIWVPRAGAIPRIVAACRLIAQGAMRPHGAGIA